ncbi:hypothetical protein CEXT_637771 [Caerostris extrusa]|uniref:Uncharacterized protein n=1 Tax=Caerostris extrusa TaxID=172846 RepID=A0AAV4UJA0_CAEEX|nr:hypothetical protein CEXT_637771 [Caerostris extrusa]
MTTHYTPASEKLGKQHLKTANSTGDIENPDRHFHQVRSAKNFKTLLLKVPICTFAHPTLLSRYLEKLLENSARGYDMLKPACYHSSRLFLFSRHQKRSAGKISLSPGPRQAEYQIT